MLLFFSKIVALNSYFLYFSKTKVQNMWSNSTIQRLLPPWWPVPGAFAFFFPRSRSHGPTPAPLRLVLQLPVPICLGWGLMPMTVNLECIMQKFSACLSQAWGEFRIFKNSLINLIVLKTTILITYQLKTSFSNVPHLRMLLIISAVHL